MRRRMRRGGRDGSGRVRGGVHQSRGRCSSVQCANWLLQANASQKTGRRVRLAPCGGGGWSSSPDGISHGPERVLARLKHAGKACAPGMSAPRNLRSQSTCCRTPGTAPSATRGQRTMDEAARERIRSRSDGTWTASPTGPAEHGQWPRDSQPV